MAGADAPVRFAKMHGAGNDFVLLDLRHGLAAPDAALCRWLADRHRGVGCDQILTIEPATTPGHHARYAIWNADGSRAGQCGNGARCVAAWLAREAGDDAQTLWLESPAGRHPARRLAGGEWQIGMGRPQFAPAAVPLAGFADEAPYYALTLPEAVPGGRLKVGVVSLGNPHALVEVPGVACAEVARLGQALQRSDYFPESVNVGFAEVVDARHIRLRVYERGVGETLACGSGACAAAAILMRRGRVAREVTVSLPGGDLSVAWPEEAGEMHMSGPAAFVFEGELPQSLWEKNENRRHPERA